MVLMGDAVAPMKTIKHLIEYSPVYLLYRVCRWLGFKRTSDLGGFLGRHLGYLYGRSTQIATKNMARALPDLSPEAHNALIRQAAENFGRTFFEYFVLDLADQDPTFKCDLVNYDLIQPYIRGDRPIMLFSAHIGNWEIGAKDYVERGLPLTPIYRPLNNPYVDQLILKCRGAVVTHQIPKGRRSGLASLRVLKSGQHMVVLADQKYNEGVDVPFFGHPAKTADGFVKLAIAANALMIPVVVTRHHKTKFVVRYSPDIIDPDTLSMQDCLLKINHHIEDWIKSYPDQWFWFHRRWDKAFYKEKMKKV
jgi:Kdo2-lipid IVA lauroyltransferase/acyltransferase